MTPRQFELALRRQRLQWQVAREREDLIRHSRPLLSTFSAVDRVKASAGYLRAHPQWLVGGLVALLVARPRRAFRWLRRGVFAWQAWRKLREHLQQP